ncbi:L-alpha-amino acid transmembrane transporter [Aureococcus anophagefferens]|uniref:L-alpha-amino acid transmembrane transporter n=1 Tax=Aureococcus anophagefferens TaxID=44056 RepID=A0ABR1G3J9_AURAN
MIQAPLVDDAATRRRSSGARYESPLPLAGLVALTFFSVTGGPFGQELLVKAGGPLVALGSFALMTLLWSVPEALMTAELSSAFPEAAGFAAWSNARTARFGPGSTPAALAKKSDTAGTPTLAILLSAGGVLALSRLSFEAIVATENLLYVVSMVIELSAFYRRKTRKDLDRRYVAPLSDGALATLAPAVLCLALVAAVQPLEVWLLSAGLLVAASRSAPSAKRGGEPALRLPRAPRGLGRAAGRPRRAARLGGPRRRRPGRAAGVRRAPPGSTGDEAASPLTS